MKRLIGSAVLLSLVFSSDYPLLVTTTAFAAGKVSSSYSYLKGAGKVVYKTFEDTSRGIVIHDFNGDGYTDVGYGTGGHCVPGAECAGNQTEGRAEIFLNDRKSRLNLKTKQAFAGKTLSWKLGEALHVAIAYDPKKNGKSTLADITGDGRADWLLFNSRNTMYPKNTSIIQGKGKKLKVGPRKMPLITYHSGTLADIDNDGDLDLVWSLNKTFISYNNGRGKFTCKNVIKGIGMVDFPPYKMCFDQLDSTQPILNKNGWSYSALVIDLNKDGLPEVITANGNAIDENLNDPKPSASGKIFVFKNRGGKLQSFKKVQTIPGPGKWPDQKGRKFSVWAADAQAADLDGDGDLDGLFYHECGDFCTGTNPIVILKNLGNGKVKRWQIINASPARGSYKDSDRNKACGAPQVVDLNGDKRPDLVFNYSHNYNGSMKDAHKQIWINKGNGKFKRLTTPIFAKVSGNSRKAKIVALHANKDKKIDWLVIWDDGTYATLIAGGGGSLLPAAYSRLANQLSNSAQLLSFNQIQMTDLLDLNPDSGITLGFQADRDGSMHHLAYGLRYGDTHLSFMMNSSLLGLYPAGSLHVESPKTRYVGIRHKYTLGNWTADGQITYGYAQGKGSNSYVQDVKDIHALGFSLATRYRLNPDQHVLFSVFQPMRIERGSLVFDGVVDDLVPDGRQTDLTLGFNYQLNQGSAIKTAFTYTTDRNHYQGQRNSQIMLTYSGRF